PQGVIFHEEHDDIGRRAPDLITYASSVNGHKHRCAPAMSGAACRQSSSVAASEYKGELYAPGDDSDALCRFQKFLRNALIRRVHDLTEDLGRLIGAVNIVLAIRGDSWQSGE